MIVYRLQGNEATALVGGTAIGILLIVHFIVYKERHLEKITEYFIGGFQFGFKVFYVIPIAFFYLGDAGFKSILNTPLPKGSAGIVNDLGFTCPILFRCPENSPASPWQQSVRLPGSTGQGFPVYLLQARWQSCFLPRFIRTRFNGADFSDLGRGGTLVPWALIPAAAICKVDPFELARKNFIPVAGLVVTTIAAIVILP